MSIMADGQRCMLIWCVGRVLRIYREATCTKYLLPELDKNLTYLLMTEVNTRTTILLRHQSENSTSKTLHVTTYILCMFI